MFFIFFQFRRFRNIIDFTVYSNPHIPFSLNVEAASAHLASWLSDDCGDSTFSVVGVFSCSTNTNLLENALDPALGKDLRLFVHLTTRLYNTGMRAGHQKYSDQEMSVGGGGVPVGLLKCSYMC